MNFPRSVAASTLLGLLYASSATAQRAGERTEAVKEFRCQVPMELHEFETHLVQGLGRQAIRWNIRSLDPTNEAPLRLVQVSVEAVSPSAALMPPPDQKWFQVSSRALTLEPKWLDSLRGSDVVNLLSQDKQLVLWINESYQVFVIEPEDLRDLPRTNPYFHALDSGAYIFTNEIMGFLIRKDLGFLTACPLMVDGRVTLSSKQITAEIVRFAQDMKVRAFFDCEALLLPRQM